MKLLLDFNLSPRLVGMIVDLFPGSIHVREAGFAGETLDKAIWDSAEQNGFTLLTSDRDFLDIAERYGHPPKLIRFQSMNYRTRFAAELIRRNAVLISEFDKSDRGALLL